MSARVEPDVFYEELMTDEEIDAELRSLELAHAELEREFDDLQGGAHDRDRQRALMDRLKAHVARTRRFVASIRRVVH